eukprot:CAMPEP_0174706196 /NCGR_PEP_ID=MMETSP1094-20130205/9137_1 /TAXON_ID=156173 /ORGANISM="Chrysochromulina brevifilum, Strain UTEX LB 985" /LENGTH=48 /DNA_ID= /DNA_START= /DNA_END= /DNA_ORIENTATION=
MRTASTVAHLPEKFLDRFVLEAAFKVEAQAMQSVMAAVLSYARRDDLV